MKTKLTLLLACMLITAVAAAQNNPPVPAGPGPKQKTYSSKERHAVTKDVLLRAKSVNELMKLFDYENTLPVVSFTMTAVLKGGKGPVELASGSDRFTTEMKTVFENVNGGDKIYIEYIKAMGPDGKIRNLPPIHIILG